MATIVKTLDADRVEAVILDLLDLPEYWVSQTTASKLTLKCKPSKKIADKYALQKRLLDKLKEREKVGVYENS